MQDYNVLGSNKTFLSLSFEFGYSIFDFLLVHVCILKLETETFICLSLK